MKNEGFVPHIYKDTLGYDTVGYGFKCSDLSADELECNGGAMEPMSKEVASAILDIKLVKLKKKVYSQLGWLKFAPMNVQEAVCEMAYQMGVAGMLGFKNTLALMEAGEYEKAASNMLKSKWATQTPNRARYVADLVKGAKNG